MAVQNGDKPYLIIKDDEIRLAVTVQPNAKRSAVKGIHAGRLKISIASVPVDGKANKELISFLADELGCPLNAVRIIKGETNKQKTVAIRGVLTERVDRWLSRLSDKL